MINFDRSSSIVSSLELYNCNVLYFIRLEEADNLGIDAQNTLGQESAVMTNAWTSEESINRKRYRGEVLVVGYYRCTHRYRCNHLPPAPTARAPDDLQVIDLNLRCCDRNRKRWTVSHFQNESILRSVPGTRGSHCWQVVSSLGLSRMPLLSRRRMPSR